ncbi:hypothetical protein [Kitasatospora sp. NPDC085879]|uniref:hypothetical protein n=1 Tax=Kitasatospora sp. NPDC085879 TaxID=3154769 RepID=UPI000BB15597|nr:hypothetical protein [Streptomyces sp. TLI_235]PBC70040.1 hypothetical protein BX265_7425 [Streptomyces sp. TLI_235]
MTGIAITLRALHDGERRMEHDLLAAAERHRADHEIRHVATDVARWSHEHVERLAHAASHYGLDLAQHVDHPSLGRWTTLREKTAEALGRRPETGLVLLHDLRDLHLTATENSLNWEMLAQTAKATRDSRLLDLATACHPQTLRQMRWTNTMIKTLAPQLLTCM